MTRNKIEEIIRQHGYIQQGAWRFYKEGEIIEVDSNYVLLDTERMFDRRSNYPVMVRHPENRKEFDWLFETVALLNTDYGFENIAVHNRIMIDTYPITLKEYNKERIHIL